MALVYFDSSAFVKLLVREAGSDLAATLWDGCDAAFSSRLSYVEVRAAVAAVHRNHELTDRERASAERRWDTYWTAVRPIELTSNVMRSAGDLAGLHRLRGGDAVHLASALLLDPSGTVFAAWDRRLTAAAVGAGFVIASD